MSHLGNNHTVKMQLGLGPPIHFIHMSGKHHIHIRVVWYTLYAMDGHTNAALTCMCMAQGLAAVYSRLSITEELLSNSCRYCVLDLRSGLLPSLSIQ